MAINLSKGERISLEKVGTRTSTDFLSVWAGTLMLPTLGQILISMLRFFLLDSNDKLISDKHFIFYK